MSYAYLLFNLAIATSLLWMWRRRPAFWRRWRDMVHAILWVSLPFVVWDVWATAQGHWAFSERYTLGWQLFGVPLEELLFFVVVPLACMAVWFLLPDRRRVSYRRARRMLIAAGTFGLGLSIFMMPLSYSSIVLIAFGIAAIALSRAEWLISRRRFWIFQIWALGLFMVCNTYLTALPIVIYGVDATAGVRVGAIPLEDFFYNFTLLNSFLAAFTWNQRTTFNR